jgi:hypothetical protein
MPRPRKNSLQHRAQGVEGQGPHVDLGAGHLLELPHVVLERRKRLGVLRLLDEVGQ